MMTSLVRILVAEDDWMIRSLIVETLEEAGFDVLEADGGEQALQLLISPDNVDVAVTDFNMPDVDGIAVARAARSHNPAVPILFVTARADLLSAPRTPKPYGVLEKPFKLAELADAVAELADRR